jgi:ABC-2 type transport system ATP-binding protein
MRMIVGLDAPSEGNLTVGGRSYGSLRFPLHEVGALLDAGAMHPGRSARNHLVWLADSNALPRHRVDEVLEMVGLTEAAHRRVGAFSLGMGQRLGIAAALLGDPEVLIFDEPINGLDPEGILWVRHLLRSLADEGRTVLVSSQPRRAARACRRGGAERDGRAGRAGNGARRDRGGPARDRAALAVE